MKLSTLRKIYPYLSRQVKDKKWRPLTDAELDRSMKDKQIIANCYDEAVRYSLLASEKGRAMLKKRVMIERDAILDPSYKVILNVNGKDEIYRATRRDYYGGHSSLYDNFSKDGRGLSCFNYDDSRLSLGVSIAIRKMIRRHPSMKPFLSRLHYLGIAVNRACEYNKPSNALRWFTGKEPTAIGESGINLNLKGHKEEVKTILKSLGEKTPKDYSFVALTGPLKYKGISGWHCLSVVGVNNKTEKISLINRRTNFVTKVSFDDFINRFKALVGIEH